jgi:hypothetical protein
VVGGVPDLARSTRGGGGRRRRARIWELEVSGRGPGRCSIAVGFIPSLMSGVYFDSIQSFNAKGLLQLRVPAVFFFGGIRHRRGGRPRRLHEESEGFDVNFFLF